MADTSKPRKVVKAIDFSGPDKNTADEGVRRPTPEEVEHAFAGIGEQLRDFEHTMTKAVEAFKSGVIEALRKYDEGMRASAAKVQGGQAVNDATTFGKGGPWDDEPERELPR